MKKLFEDFDITTNTNGFFTLSLSKKGDVEYNLDGHEEESNEIYLVHKKTGTEITVSSKDDLNELNSLEEEYKDCNCNPIELLKRVKGND